MKVHTKNILSLFGFDGLTRLMGFISTAYLARVLGNGLFGTINVGLALFSYRIIFSSPGLHTIGTRAVAQHSFSGRIITQVTSLRFFLSLIVSAAIIAGTVAFVGDLQTRDIIILYSASVIPNAFQIEWFYQGKQRLWVIGVARSIALLSFLAILFFLVKSPSDIQFVPIAFFVNTTLNSILLLWLYLNEKKVEPTADRDTFGWKQLLRQALPVGTASIFGQAVINLPVILLGIFAASSEVGVFSAASKLIFFLLSIDRAIYVLFYPLVARTIATNPSEIGSQVSRILSYLLMIVIPMCVGGGVLAHPIVSAIFGSQYESSANLLRILLLYFLFTVLNSIFAYVVIAAGKEKRYSMIIVVTSSILIAVLIPLTFYWKAIGASCGLVGGELVMMILMYRECLKSISSKLTYGVIKPLMCSAIMGAILLSVPGMNVLLSLFVGIASYCAGMFLSKGITKSDVVFLKERLI